MSQMGIINLITNRKKKYTTVDVALDEIAMVSLALLIAKFWPAATSLEWYWYAIITVIALIMPIRAFLKG